MSEIVEIVKLGASGDGVAVDGLYVPYTVPGDTVRIEREGTHGRISEILQRGPARVLPPCRHFGTCGGCALQHVEQSTYLAWKRGLVVTALEQRGFTNPPVEPIRAISPQTRRRAAFKAKRDGERVRLGFYEPESRNLVDLAECPVLAPPLAKLMAPLRRHLAGVLKSGDTAELFATLADNGIDLMLKLKRARDADVLMALAGFASDLKLARLSWNDEVVATAVTPEIHVGAYRIALPPGSFLQPAREGEAMLQRLVRAEAADAARAADLFSGCGTFTFVLAEKSSVHAADSDPAHIATLTAAAKQGRARVTGETRDLFRRPFAPEELTRFDCVLIDPPRTGAKAQSQALARSNVPKILYISCNAASFARDARILADGGYRLSRAVPLDQFLWSHHVETFAVFQRAERL